MPLHLTIIKGIHGLHFAMDTFDPYLNVSVFNFSK